MNILNSLFLFNKKSKKNKDLSSGMLDQYIEIAKLIKEARKQRNLTIKELSSISKIPERIINSIRIVLQLARKALFSFGRLNEYFEKSLYI